MLRLEYMYIVTTEDHFPQVCLVCDMFDCGVTVATTIKSRLHRFTQSRERSLHTKFSLDHSLLIAKGQVGMQKPQFMKMGVYLTKLIALHTTEESE